MSEFIKELIKAGARQSEQNYNNLIKKPIDYLKKNGIPNPVASLAKDAYQAAKELKEEKDVEIISSGKVKSSQGPIQQAAKARSQAKSTVNKTPSVKANMGNQDIKSMIVRIANEVGVDPAIALAIAQQESGFNPNAVGDGGKSFGLFQIHSDFHPDYKGGTDPEANTRYGLTLFKRLLDANGGSVNKAIWAYNAGQGNVNKGILPASTQQYINNIAALAPQFRQQGISADAPVSKENRAIIAGMSGQPVTANQQQAQSIIQKPRVSDIPRPEVPELIGSNEQIDAIKAQLAENINDPRNKELSIPSMYDTLNAKYNELYNTINTQDPRYQGQIVQGERYYVDPNELRDRLETDRLMANEAMLRGFAQPSQSRANDYLAERQAMYQIAKANEAGVPYADYQAALLDRQKQQILAQAAQIDAQLNMAIKNETNMFKRQELLSLLEQNNIEAKNAMAKLQYAADMDAYKNQVTAEQNAYLEQLKNMYVQQQADDKFKKELMKANYQNQLNIYRDQMKPQTTNPWQAVNSMNTMSGYDKPTMARILVANPQIAQQVLGTSDPRTIGNILGTNQMQNAPTQGGFLDMLRRKAAGIGQDIRANEQ